MPLINCKSNLILTWSVNYFLIANPVSNQIAIFAKTDAKLYVLAVTLSTQNNAKLLQQLQQIDFLTLKRCFLPAVEMKDYNVMINPS